MGGSTRIRNPAAKSAGFVGEAFSMKASDHLCRRPKTYLNHGPSASKVTLERLTMGPSLQEFASIANDGRLLSFGSSQSGRTNIWIRDMTTGKESPLASSSLEQHWPVTSPSGDKIAFSVFEKDRRAVYVSAPGGPSERVCEGCLRATDWSRDEKTLLIFGGSPYQIETLDVASHQRKPFLEHPNFNLLYARFSPDHRWVSFTVRTQPRQGRIVVAPVDGPKPIPESAWITITESTAGDWADWSPDGQTLWFSSTRDGHKLFLGPAGRSTFASPGGGTISGVAPSLPSVPSAGN
jgi:Tol biopolymer transport system component